MMGDFTEIYSSIAIKYVYFSFDKIGFVNSETLLV